MIHKHIIVPPPVESLLRPDAGNSLWPESVITNSTLRTDAMMRDKTLQLLTDYCVRVPRSDMDIAAAIAADLLGEADAAALYNSLAELMDDDACRRLALYLPFEIIPSGRLDPITDALRQAINQFLEVFTRRWRELLDARDLRANFLDGDVPEPELATEPPPMVCKAAHLTPALVAKGLLSIAHVIKLLETCTDDVLQTSLADAIRVSANLGQLTDNDVRYMLNSPNPFVSKIGFAADSGSRAARVAASSSIPKSGKLSNLERQSSLDFARTESRLRISKSNTPLPAARAAWLRSQAEQQTVSAWGRRLAHALLQDKFSLATLRLIASSGDKLHARIVIEGIGRAAEHLAATDQDRAHALLAAHTALLDELWSQRDHELQDTLTGLWCRLTTLGVAEPGKLVELDIAVPTFDAPFDPGNPSLQADLAALTALTQAIASHPQLGHWLCPVAILYGSAIKGYRGGSADSDVAIFVKPDVPFERRAEIQQILLNLPETGFCKGRALEFWLTSGGERLAIRDFTDPDTCLGDSTLVHVLFAGAWVGDEIALRDLYRDVLTGYLYSSGKRILRYDARQLWLSEMERDTLQYRLMHRGYWQYYPKTGGLPTPRASAVDGDSAFWDSGYRRLATKLFLARVFLPQLTH